MRKALSLVLALLLAFATPPVSAQNLDRDVQRGIGQVDNGDYDGAILTLDNAARRLAADKARPNDLAQAYLYLGIAYIGKGREAAAKAKFREAIAQIKSLSLSAEKFSPKVIDLFEAARAEESRETAAPTPTPAAGGAGGANGSAQKKGGSKAIFIVGGLAAAGGVAAAASGGGGGGSSSGASTSTTPTLQTLNFAGTLPPQSLDCKQVVATKAGTLEARLTWTNGQLGLSISCQEHDPPYTGCGTVNRTSNTSATLIASVVQKTYDICPNNYNDAADTYTLVIQFP